MRSVQHIKPPCVRTVHSNANSPDESAECVPWTLRPAKLNGASSSAVRSTMSYIRPVTLALAAVSFLSLSLVSPAYSQATSGVVYTADETGNTVSRIDLQTGEVDIVPVSVAPHNIQYVPEHNLVLVSGPSVAEGGHTHGSGEQAGHGHDGTDAGKVVLLDAANITAGAVAEVDVGAHPAHVVADTAGSRAFVTNAEDDTVTVIDIGERQAIATIATGDYPHGLRISPDGASIYVANVQDGTVSVIDTESLSEVARIEVGNAPVQVGFTPDGGRVYVSLRDEDKVAVIDTATREVVARIDVGRSPIQVYVTPDGRFVYVANQGTSAEPDDTVSVIDVANGTVIETIQTGAGAHGVVVSDDGAFAFVTNIVAATVSEIEVATQAVVRTHSVGSGPNGVTFQPQ